MANISSFMNGANYFITQDGIISKLDSYWDQLREVTNHLENISKNIVKKLFNSFLGSLLFIILIFWLDLGKDFSLIVLSLITLGTIALAVVQITAYLEFVKIKKKGMILYNELSREVEWNYDNNYVEDLPVDERILLSNFLLACELQLNAYVYLSLLALLPFINIAFFVFYYLYMNQYSV